MFRTPDLFRHGKFSHFLASAYHFLAGVRFFLGDGLERTLDPSSKFTRELSIALKQRGIYRVRAPTYKFLLEMLEHEHIRYLRIPQYARPAVALLDRV